MALSSCLLVLTGCDDWLPGKPKESERWVPDHEIKDFTKLYGQNCNACHSDGTTVSASIAMNNPLYLALVTDAQLRDFTANGVEGTSMPPFDLKQGGSLTDKQIDIIVEGIRKHWAKPEEFAGVDLPAYSAPLGDPEAGKRVFANHCASCHGPDGKGGEGFSAGSVVDPNYLALVSNQGLRTVVIVGRPEFGMPDWRGENGSTPMSSNDISDVVAWMVSHRNPLWSQELAQEEKASGSAPIKISDEPTNPQTESTDPPPSS